MISLIFDFDYTAALLSSLKNYVIFIGLSLCLLLSVVPSMLCDFIHYNLIILLFLWNMIDLHLFLSSGNLL